MKIYLAGPMRGIPQFNFPMFNYFAKKLRAEGHKVFNPAERDIKKFGNKIQKNPQGSLQVAEKIGFSLRDALGDDTKWLCKHADAVALMPGWRDSKGACAEKALAKALGLKIIYLRNGTT